MGDLLRGAQDWLRWRDFVAAASLRALLLPPRKHTHTHENEKYWVWVGGVERKKKVYGCYISCLALIRYKRMVCVTSCAFPVTVENKFLIVIKILAGGTKQYPGPPVHHNTKTTPLTHWQETFVIQNTE